MIGNDGLQAAQAVRVVPAVAAQVVQVVQVAQVAQAVVVALVVQVHGVVMITEIIIMAMTTMIITMIIALIVAVAKNGGMELVIVDEITKKFWWLQLLITIADYNNINTWNYLFSFGSNFGFPVWFFYLHYIFLFYCATWCQYCIQIN